MKMIIWKELRENVKWAVLGLVAMSLALSWAWRSDSRGEFGNQDSILSGLLQMVMGFGPILMGGALGLLQMSQELKMDRWAVLIHRPLAAQQIFYGKVIAGFLLYFSAVAMPFFVAVVWVAIPGNVAAPFTPGMILPGLFSILAGSLFYLAGLLTTLSQARWLGSKTLGFLAVLTLYLILTAFEQFAVSWLYLGFWGFSAGVVFWAARGCFLTKGLYFNQRQWSQRANTLLAQMGVLGLEILVLGLLSWSFNSDLNYYSYRIDQLGRILVVHEDAKQKMTVTDLSGITASPPNGHRVFLNDDFLESLYLRSRKDAWNEYRTSYHGFFRLGEDQHLAWYYDSQRKLAVGYSSKSRLPERQLSPDGWGPFLENSPRRFPSSMIPLERFWGGRLQLWASNQQLVCVDFSSKQFSELIHDANTSVMKFATTPDDEDLVGRKEKILVLDPQHFAVYHPDGTLRLSVAFGEEFNHPEDILVSLNKTTHHYYLRQNPQSEEHEGRKIWRPGKLIEYDANGILITKLILPPLPEVKAFGGETMAAISPLIAWPLGYAFQWVLAKLGVPDAVAPSITNDDWVPIFWSFGGSLLAIIGGAYVAGAYAFSSRVRRDWSLMLLAFGLPGLVTMWLIRDWPLRLSCPHCHAKTPVDLPVCPHCGWSWSPPPKDGTELFTLSRVLINKP